MWNLPDTHVAWDSTETENWEALIEIVWLDDATYIHERLFVLVGSCTHVMERVRHSRSAIAPRVVDCGNEGNLPAWAQVVHKTWPNAYLETFDDKVGVYDSVQGGATFLEILQSRIERVKLLSRLLIAIDES